ncbi:MAG: dTDP-4-dehydrorhamnose reductase [Candidatus Omnitrophota bacterium]
MKILITGAAGMLADAIIPVLLKNGKHEVIQTDVNRRLPDIEALDVTDPAGVMGRISAVKPDFVFHLGAETDVDLCEQEPDRAYMVNTLGTENIALACAQNNTGLLYISSGAVFGGEKRYPYTEFDTPRPVSVYGDSKLQGEYIVKGILTKYFIVRAGWMVGGWELDKKFVYKIVRQVREGKKHLKVVFDKAGSPTFTKDFAANLMSLIGTGRYGTYHLANKGGCTRYDIAVKIVEYMGLSGEVSVEPITSAKFPLPAPRACSEQIRNYKLDLLGINNMPKWEDSLREYISANKDKD